MKDLFRPGMTAEESKEAMRIHERIWNCLMSKLKYIPDHHTAEIRAIYVEEGLMDLDEAGYTCQTILARRMAEKFYDIPIAVTVFDGKTYGAYIGNWSPYELSAYQPMIATLAIQMGLFNKSEAGEIDGTPVTWWRNVRA